MQTLDTDRATIAINAPIAAVFDLITDITQMARFSPELVSCRWLDGARNPSVGARFEAVNQLPGHRPWKNRPVVTAYQPPSLFQISRTEPFAGTLVWTYELSPADASRATTLLDESYRVSKPISRIGWLIIERGFGGIDRRADLRRGMEATLHAIKHAAETTSQQAPPDRGKPGRA